MMNPLFGIYELRLADAHLPGEDADSAFCLVGVDSTEPLAPVLHICCTKSESVAKTLVK